MPEPAAAPPAAPATPVAAVVGTLAVVGIGLVGSSIALAARQNGLVGRVVGYDISAPVREEARSLGLCDHVADTVAEALAGADMVVVSVPVGAFASVAADLAPHLGPGTIVTDTGSVKRTAVEELGARLPFPERFVASHPLAGTEHSGPSAGFATLFQGRWTVVTPTAATDPAAVAAVEALWRGMGSMVEEMSVEHHDRVLAITSHLPHLIAYTIVGTATDLAEDMKQEVIKFSASGFRDFTRIAASDPTMWRDVFLKNREAVLEILQRFTEDLTALQRAIRRGEGETLFDLFTRTRAIRRGVIEAKQAD